MNPILVQEGRGLFGDNSCCNCLFSRVFPKNCHSLLLFLKIYCTKITIIQIRSLISLLHQLLSTLKVEFILDFTHVGEKMQIGNWKLHYHLQIWQHCPCYAQMSLIVFVRRSSFHSSGRKISFISSSVSGKGYKKGKELTKSSVLLFKIPKSESPRTN